MRGPAGWHDQPVSEPSPPAADSAPVTRARRAAERRLTWASPLIGVLLGLSLVTTKWTSSAFAVVLVVVVAQLLVAAGWHEAIQAEQATTGALAGVVLGFLADAAVLIPSAPTTLEPPIAVLGVGFLVVVVQQLARRDAHQGAVVSMAATASLAAVTALGAGWIVLDGDIVGRDVVWAGGLALVTASLARLVPSDTWAPWLALAAGVFGGWLAGVGGGGLLTPSVGLWVGLACGVAVGLSDAFVRGATAVFRQRWWMTGAFSVLLAAPLAYLAVRLTL